MNYAQDPFQMKMEQFRAICQTANMGEPLDGDDALALIEITRAVMEKLATYQDEEYREQHKAIHGAEWPNTPNLHSS